MTKYDLMKRMTLREILASLELQTSFQLHGCSFIVLDEKNDHSFTFDCRSIQQYCETTILSFGFPLHSYGTMSPHGGMASEVVWEPDGNTMDIDGTWILDVSRACSCPHPRLEVHVFPLDIWMEAYTKALRRM